MIILRKQLDRENNVPCSKTASVKADDFGYIIITAGQGFRDRRKVFIPNHFLVLRLTVDNRITMRNTYKLGAVKYVVDSTRLDPSPANN